MAEAATRSDTTTADFLANGLARQRVWTQIVACAGVALVVALNTALPDIAAAGSTRPTFVMAAIAAVAAIIIPLFAPERDGRQLCAARRLLRDRPRRLPTRRSTAADLSANTGPPNNQRGARPCS